MTAYETRITRMTVASEGKPLFSEQATHVEIDDAGGGEFIVITQCGDNERPGVIAIDKAEWAHITHAVDTLMKEVRDE